ncbi:phage baseplate protein [Pseudomonas shirazensis]|uniref:Phage baseplate protein n=1 Tax=Pseudomonas shirazensis TaxID=2745494 RepID=A0ABU8ZUQ5_9PSED
MSIVNIFTRQAPTIAGYAFDAVLEDTFEATVTITSVPIESGVRISDHRILNPFKWTMTGAISNNPVKVQLTDFLGGGLSNFTDNPIVAAVAGLSAGWLAGSDETRGSSTLGFLVWLMQASEPFDIDAGDILLKNMAITRLSRTKEPRNENGLEFVVELQEVIELDRIARDTQCSIPQLRPGDPSQSALARAIKRGQAIAKEANEAVTDAVNGILDGVF